MVATKHIVRKSHCKSQMCPLLSLLLQLLHRKWNCIGMRTALTAFYSRSAPLGRAEAGQLAPPGESWASHFSGMFVLIYYACEA